MSIAALAFLINTLKSNPSESLSEFDWIWFGSESHVNFYSNINFMAPVSLFGLNTSIFDMEGDFFSP